MALPYVVRTDINSIEMSSTLREMTAKVHVNLVNVSESHTTQSHAALVGYDDYGEPLMVEPGDRLLDAGEELELVQTRDIFALRRL